MTIVQARNALSDLDKDLFKQTLAKFGLSTANILVKVLILAILLIMFGIFLLLGIAAFTQASDFTSVINSVLAASGIGGISVASADAWLDKDMIEGVMDRILGANDDDEALLPEEEDDDDDGEEVDDAEDEG
eukprot:TRINITY_DN8206_c0_g1_i1.p3 TRINITY_DN8206_c0_g1~~TRINITY_DN8206_c0_g1_i1.p3  ORF type:complete len:132 (+),score=38.75 TRINITY_DN8206_c0_g1_i1:1968-2363(+)